MALKDTTKHMNTLLTQICNDLSKAENGNKAASQRVRTCTVKLEKVAKLFRKESVANEKRGGTRKKPATKKKAKIKTKAKKTTTARKTTKARPKTTKKSPLKQKKPLLLKKHHLVVQQKRAQQRERQQKKQQVGLVPVLDIHALQQPLEHFA